LKDLWNKVKIPHLGRYPTEYHQWISDALMKIDKIANGGPKIFKELFQKYVLDVVKENPWLLKKDWWRKYGDEFQKWWSELFPDY